MPLKVHRFKASQKMSNLPYSSRKDIIRAIVPGETGEHSLISRVHVGRVCRSDLPLPQHAMQI